MGNASRGVAVGNLRSGLPVVFVTETGGAGSGSWVELDSGKYTSAPSGIPGYNNLLDVASRPRPLGGGAGTAAKEYWAVGDDRCVIRIVYTNDWNVDVQSISTNQKLALSGITFIDHDTAVVVGTDLTTGDGVVWRVDLTTLSWTDISPSGFKALNDIAAIGHEAWIVGDRTSCGSSGFHGTILYCDDISVSSPNYDHDCVGGVLCEDTDLYSVAAKGGPSGKEILIGGSSGKLIRSINGGPSSSVNWDELDSHLRREIKSVSVPAPDVGWILGGYDWESWYSTATDRSLMHY
jgi:hypothetical protein